MEAFSLHHSAISNDASERVFLKEKKKKKGYGKGHKARL